MTKQEWIKYGALFLLAVAAFGVAGIALTNPRAPGEAVSPVTASSPAATPTATATRHPQPPQRPNSRKSSFPPSPSS
ncbi:hypothetical protein AHiyo4_40010 [Arthrobacter sp. Hiyo4]|nr:hypothetical protein AHiyo4_40010 [Arthrobacter sp. Hiyo4]